MRSVLLFLCFCSTATLAGEVMQGVPPERSSQVTFANYREQPFNRWAFRNIGAFFNVLQIARDGRIDEFRTAPARQAETIAQLEVELGDGSRRSVAKILENNDTDGFLVLRGERILYEQYFHDFKRQNRHIWFSMTKSLVSTAAGILVAEGKLALDKSPADYIPELKGSGFERVTVQNVLDHDSAILFKENYTDPDSEFFQYYAPALNMAYLPGARDLQPDKARIYGVHDFLQHFVRADSELEPGAAFDYNSTNADVLGWLVARLSGMPLEQFLEEKIWAKLHTEHDAAIAADRAYMAVATGGMNSSLRDAARFGQLMLQRGKYAGQQIIPSAWVDASLNIDERLRANMRNNPKYQNEPWEAYRNMWWVLDSAKGEYAAVGIHGQVIYINRAANMVAAWFSSQGKASAANNPQFRAKMLATRAIAATYE